MQTVVLAAGEGTRMRPLTETRPKPMLPVAGKPLLWHTLTDAVKAGASRLIIVVGYEEGVVREYFGRELHGVSVEYVTQDDLTGTAAAVREAESVLTEDSFVVLNGDVIYDRDGLAELYTHDAAIGAAIVDDPRPYGVLEVSGGTVRDIIEKPSDPPSNLVNAGAYVFPPQALAWLSTELSERGEHEITDVVHEMCQETSVSFVEFDSWLDVGRPWELLIANEWKLAEQSRSIAGEVHKGANVRGDVVVESGATIKEGVTIEGPVFVGSGASVGPNAYIRSATTITNNTTVGHGVEVKNSILMDGATVPHLSYVGDSILGRDVNFGAGTIVANLRHDDEPVKMTVKGERVSTGKRKLGVVVGDGTKTGINTSLDPGVKLSSYSRTEPGERVTRDR